MTDQVTSPAAAPADNGATTASNAPNPATANAETGGALTGVQPATADHGEGEGASSQDISGEPAADNAANSERRNKVPARERISQLTNQIRQRDATIAQLEQERRELLRTARPVGDPLDYASDADYQRALAEQVAAQTEARSIERQQRNMAIERQNAVVEQWEERCADFRAVAPDFDAVVFNPALNVPPAIVELTASIENGPAVAYFLAKNPNEINRIARLSDRDAAIAIGQLSNRVSLPSPKRATAAPAPVRTVNGSGNTVSADPVNLSHKDYRQWRMRGNRIRRITR